MGANSDDAFSVGDAVVAVDIKSLPAINGVQGVITVYQESSGVGRYGVKFPPPYGIKSLKAANLQLVPSAQKGAETPDTRPGADDLSWLDDSPMFCAGDEVMAVKIKALPEINGVMGVVTSQKPNGRFGVRFPSPYGLKTLKTANLQLVRKPHSPELPEEVDAAPKCFPHENTTSNAEPVVAAPVRVVSDPAALEALCRADDSLPVWKPTKARHAGRQGVVTEVDGQHLLVEFSKSEQCWFPKTAVSTIRQSPRAQQTLPHTQTPPPAAGDHGQRPAEACNSPVKSPAVSAMKVPSNFKCPVEVYCETITDVDHPGGLLREDSALDKERRVQFNERNLDVKTFNPRAPPTPEEKLALKKQEQEAKDQVALLLKRQQGVAGVVEDEKPARLDVEREEHKRRKGLKGACSNERTQIEIRMEGQLIEDLLDVESTEDLARLEVVEAEAASFRDASTAEAAERGRAAAAIKAAAPAPAAAVEVTETAKGEEHEATASAGQAAAFSNPAAIFSELGWSYDTAEQKTVHSPTKKPLVIEEVDGESEEEPPAEESTPVAPCAGAGPPVPAQQPQQAVAVEAPELAAYATQVQTLTTIAQTLRESNVDMKDELATLRAERSTHAEDVAALKRRSDMLEERLAAMATKKAAAAAEKAATAAAPADDFKAKYERLHEQMKRGYEAMQTLETDNAALKKRNAEAEKVCKLFQSHDKQAYLRAVGLAGGKAVESFEASSESKLLKKYKELEAQHKAAQSEVAALRKETGVAAGRTHSDLEAELHKGMANQLPARGTPPPPPPHTANRTRGEGRPTAPDHAAPGEAEEHAGVRCRSAGKVGPRTVRP